MRRIAIFVSVIACKGWVAVNFKKTQFLMNILYTKLKTNAKGFEFDICIRNGNNTLLFFSHPKLG